MTDTNTPAADALHASVTSIGDASTTDPYAIAPEDRSIADAILAMDPREAPPPYDIPEGWRPAPLRLTALPPERQQEVRDLLHALPSTFTDEQRAAKEEEFTANVVQSMRGTIRLKTGLSPNATPYHREQLAIARDYQALADEFDRLSEELSKVREYRTEVDPHTGEVKAVPVHQVQGNRLTAYVARREELQRQMRLLLNDDSELGVEGQRRMRQALHESVLASKAVDAQLAERAEAKRRAAEIVREGRINAQAESLARMQRNGSS